MVSDIRKSSTGSTRTETFISDIKEERRHTTVYVIEAGDFVKIGVAENINTRLKSLQVGNPLKLKPLRAIVTTSRLVDNDLEKVLHKRYQKAKAPADNEWFYKEGVGELLLADKADICWIAKAEGIDVFNSVIRIDGFTRELFVELRGYLDSKTLIALKQNSIFSFDDLERFLNSGFLAHGIGEIRYRNIHEAYQMYKKDKEEEAS